MNRSLASRPPCTRGLLRALLVVAPLVAGLASGAAWSATIAVGPIKGPGAVGLADQIRDILCERARCVDGGQFARRGSPDWKKAKKAKVEAFILGTIKVKARASRFALVVQTPRSAAAIRRVLQLQRGLIAPKDLATFVEDLGGLVELKSLDAPPPPPVRERAPERVAEAPPPTAPPPQPPPQARTPSEPPAKEPQSRTERLRAARATPDTSERGAKRGAIRARRWPPTFASVDVGASAFSRSLVYSGLSSGNLREYSFVDPTAKGLSSLPLFPALRFGLTVTPFAPSDTPVISGLGIEGSLDLQPWLKSRKQSDPNVLYPSTFTRIDGALRWAIALPTPFPMAIVPAVGARFQSYTTGAATDGSRLGGLPDIRPLGLRGSLGIEAALLDEALSVWLRGSALPVFSAGEILGATYFPKGSVFGFEGAGGLGVRFASFLALRASFEFVQYRFRFQTTESDTYRASGATEQMLSGSIGLRLSF